MSASITQSYGTLAQLIADSAKVHTRLDTLTQQASSGLKADTYAGLGSGAAIALNLHPQLAALQTWQNNIDAAAGRMQVTQAAMTQLQQIAADFNAQLNNLNGLDPQNVDVVAASARDALAQVADLLDTQDGGVYVFAGQDTANPPVPDPDAIASSAFYQQIASAVAGLGTTPVAGIISSTLATASPGSTASPFSAYMSQPLANPTPPPANNINPPVVQTGPGQTQAVGLLASANTFATSSGSSTTGSAMRDLMRALATIGSLSSAQANDTDFSTLVQDTRTSLGGAIDALGVEAGALGNVQSNLTATQTQLSSVATALSGQVSSAEDVDMAATLSNITTVQTQLQASYQLIAGLSGLSLAKFLPVS